jgi:hypothetical protein
MARARGGEAGVVRCPRGWSPAPWPPASLLFQRAPRAAACAVWERPCRLGGRGPLQRYNTLYQLRAWGALNWFRVPAAAGGRPGLRPGLEGCNHG